MSCGVSCMRVWPDIQYLPTSLQHLHNQHERGAMGFEWTTLSTSRVTLI